MSLSQWADQIEQRIQTAPQVVAVGPRVPSHRKLFMAGLVGAAAVLVWAAAPHLSTVPTSPPNQSTVHHATIQTLGQAASLRAASSGSLPITLPAAVLSRAPIPAPPTIVKSKMPATTIGIARQLLKEKGDLSRFMALAVTVETYAKAPYWDTGGLNVGMGYCITRRTHEEGAARVQADLLAAGLAAADVGTLMGHDRHAQRKVVINEAQAVALLRQVAPDYEAHAKAFVGKPVFDALSPNRQAALTWLAYNTGPHLDQFNHLREAVQNNHPAQALDHLAPTYRDAQGKMVINKRAEAYLVAAYWSDKGLHAAVSDSAHFEAVASTQSSPVNLGKAIDPTAPISLGKAARPLPQVKPHPSLSGHSPARSSHRP